MWEDEKVLAAAEEQPRQPYSLLGSNDVVAVFVGNVGDPRRFHCLRFKSYPIGYRVNIQRMNSTNRYADPMFAPHEEQEWVALTCHTCMRDRAKLLVI